LRGPEEYGQSFEKNRLKEKVNLNRTESKR
jgi:hypothetical protein